MTSHPSAHIPVPPNHPYTLLRPLTAVRIDLLHPTTPELENQQCVLSYCCPNHSLGHLPALVLALYACHTLDRLPQPLQCLLWSLICRPEKLMGWLVLLSTTYWVNRFRNLGYSRLYTALSTDAGAHPPGLTVWGWMGVSYGEGLKLL